MTDPHRNRNRRSKGRGEREGVSQLRLIWLRFKRHRLGLVGGGLVCVLSLVFLLADFLAPYDYNTQHRRYPYVPPMLGRIHLFDEGRLSRPFVYGLRRVPDPEAIGVWRYEEDRTVKYPLRLFVRGDRYRFWGLFSTDVHLFGTGEPPDSPGQLFLFGTNQLGQDLFSQVLMGGRVSLALGPLVILASFLVGILLGGLSGYYGGWVDTLLQRLVELTMALPRLALLLALSAAIPSKAPPMARFWAIVAVLAAVSWAPLARVIRGQFLALREEDYVLAARALGAGDGRVLFRHILPNTTSTLVVSATLAVPNVIILESVLSFLKFGLHPPLVSWGMLLQQLQDKLVLHLSFHPWYLIPGAFIFVTVLAFNFLGDALRDAVDPFAAASPKA